MKPSDSAVPNATAGRPRVLAAVLCIGVSLVAVLATTRFCYRPDPVDSPWTDGVAPTARAIVQGQTAALATATDPDGATARMRRSNPEWDFMGRTFLVMALGEVALRDAASAPANFRVVDRIVRDTLEVESTKGPRAFLMAYAKGRPYRVQPARSLFVDGELAMMLGVECRVARAAGATNDPAALAAAAGLRARVAQIEESLAKAGDGFAESYPDECWIFDHAFALAALRLADRELGSDHDALSRRWLARAKVALREPATGLPYSAFTIEGRPSEGPEGSSVWLAAHLFGAVDPAFARELYSKSKLHLARGFLGFAWSREWPPSLRTREDIDSGVVVPGVDASPSASGLVMIAAASFGDRAFLSELRTSLEFAGFPIRDGNGLRYAASNGVGDAVLLYALVVGPMWREIAAPEGKP